MVSFKHYFLFFITLTFCLVASLTYAQKDSLVVDSSVVKSNSIKHSIKDSILSFKTVIPKKSGLYSSIVPGLGQLYNKQYWKIGVVYAVLGAGTGFIIYNNKEYKYWRKIYIGRLSADPDAMAQESYLNTNQVKLQQDYYQNNRDLSVAITGLGYALQIIDAIVFAHLKDFDISPDISLKLQPSSMQNTGAGIGLALKFK